MSIELVRKPVGSSNGGEFDANTASAQIIAGAKTWTGAQTAPVFIPSLNASQATAFTLTSASPSDIYITSPAGAINQDLPSAGVTAGQLFRLTVSGGTEANTVTLRSSGGNTIDIISTAGTILVQALQATPTSAAHWKVISVYEELNTTRTFGNITVPTAVNVRLVRQNKTVTFYVDGFGSKTKDGTNGPVSITAVIDARFRPAAGQYFAVNGAVGATRVAMVFFVNANGSLEFYTTNTTTGDAATVPATASVNIPGPTGGAYVLT